MTRRILARDGWLALGFIGLLGISATAQADPCGMVPPSFLVPPAPGVIDKQIARVGRQMTYVFYMKGVETFVIRPSFEGKVEEFGMLIPFPSPPAIRKVPDDIFSHVAAAIDPPEVVVDLRPQFGFGFGGGIGGGGGGFGGGGGAFVISVVRPDQVKVIREEAVGMYEVAVLAAGSVNALKHWIEEHKFRFPEGMEPVCQDYVEAGWCFVAVKTKVAQKRSLDPRPGMRDVNAALPKGAIFEGSVQAMGFRFRSDKLVVPMRLSAFNAGELHNVLYLLTDQPAAIRRINRRFVKRQLSGEQLYRNLTSLLPLRVIGGKVKRDLNGNVTAIRNMSRTYRKNLVIKRNPTPHNGLARELFAGDLLTVVRKRLSHPHEEAEKQLLRIAEHFQLRGATISDLTHSALDEDRDRALIVALRYLRHMTLTVIDGDFPRDVLAKSNLTFYKYKMPRWRNSSKHYNAISQSPAPQGREGVLISGVFDAPGGVVGLTANATSSSSTSFGRPLVAALALALALICLCTGIVVIARRRDVDRNPQQID